MTRVEHTLPGSATGRRLGAELARGGREERRPEVSPGAIEVLTAGCTPTTCRYLEGRWRLRRRWRDSFSGEAAWAVGFVEVVPAEPGGFLWREQAQVRLARSDRSAASDSPSGPEVCLAARRVLLLVPAPDGAIDVRFEDGRAFHRLDLSRGFWQADHLCGSDLYRSSWRVRGEDRLEVIWEVEGPTTSGWLRSVLTRRSSDRPGGVLRRRVDAPCRGGSEPASV